MSVTARRGGQRRRARSLVLLIAALLAATATTAIIAQTTDHERSADERQSDPDRPPFLRRVNEETYERLRSEHVARLRGLPYRTPYDARVAAVRTLDAENANRAASARAGSGDAATAQAVSWSPIGPAPVANGQVQGNASGSVPVSGRVTAIAVHPTNPNIAYVGAAQGGVYRTLDGGASWTPLSDGAQSLAIGAIAIAPSSPTTVYVGTGEASAGIDSFAGVGLYRIDNAETTATLVGPINPTGVTGADPSTPFTGRSISAIMVKPDDAATVFVATSSGFAGVSSSLPFRRSLRGIYRTTNGTAALASIVFTKLAITGNPEDLRVSDIAFDPTDPSRLLAAVRGFGSEGGFYASTNALAATPAFTRTLATPVDTRARFSLNVVAGAVTAYAVSEESSGTLRKSTDRGQTWGGPISAATGFCGSQCFYDIAVATDPTTAGTILVGGSAGSGPAAALRRSIDSGTNFANSQDGVHADTHSIVFAPSDHNVVYTGNDGGVWRSSNAGATWSSLNNAGLNITQFQSIAVHPTDPNFTIGGTQDNGTQYFNSSRAWTRADFGDGGFSAIDQNAPDTSNVTMYHTYFNKTNSLIGFGRVTNVASAHDTGWAFVGCDNGVSQNGISCADSVLFYAPLARGPGNPNTVYFGTDHLYRSTDRGANNVSQGTPQAGVPISAIGISPQNDNVRIAGLSGGGVYATSTGSTLSDVTGAIPAGYVARAVVSPTDANTAYVTLSEYFGDGTAHVWKTTNLSSPSPTWSAAGAGIPDVPVDAFAINPDNPSELFAGTDIGVFRSADAGASWLPFGTGLPVVAVFDMAVVRHSPTQNLLRIATHGRGMWEASLDSGQAAQADLSITHAVSPTRVRPGANLAYTATARNAGPGDAASPAVKVTLPPGTSLVSDAFPPNWSRTQGFDGTNTFLSYSRASYPVALGNQVFTVTVSVDGSTPNWKSLTSTAAITSSTADTNAANNSATATARAARRILPTADFRRRTDRAVYRPSTAVWFVLQSSNNVGVATKYGNATDDLPVPADYDGDGKADRAVYRPSAGVWYVLQSSNGVGIATKYGNTTDDIPAPADYDGDGKADRAVFRPSTGQWFVLKSSNNVGIVTTFGLMPDDIPVPADYDGDGKADMAIYRPSTGYWYVLQSSTNTVVATKYGNTTDDIPVPGDYDGDGKADRAVYRPSTGQWFVLRSSTNVGVATKYGNAADDMPAPGDFDGDGKTDLVVYRPSTGVWFVLQSSNNTGIATKYGNAADDFPVPANYDGDT